MCILLSTLSKNRFLLVPGLLSLLLVAMAVSSPLAKGPTSESLTIQRSRAADTARWSAMSKYYQNLAIHDAERQRGREADAARWTILAEYFQNSIAAHSSQVADALRWTAIAKYYKQFISASR